MSYSLSFLRIIELFKGEVDTNIDTIEKPSTMCPYVLKDMLRFIRNKSRLVRALPDLKESSLVMSNKAGPNGPATITCVQDVNALRKDPKLYYHVSELIKHSNLSWLRMDVQPQLEGEFQHSKIVFLRDRAMKTRVVAIADWWSNVALSGIHKTFLSALAGIRNDLTFKQHLVPSEISSLGNFVYGSDMSAFTDRYPIEILREIIAVRYGDTLANHWYHIMTRKFPFDGRKVSYNCGNPMGILSSWAVSTYAHHVTKEYCCYKLALKNYKYKILGDDSCDSKEVAYRYYQTLLNKLGVQISQAKCTTSTEKYVEFAKRLFTPVGEITGIPVYLLKDIYKYPEQILELVRILRERGYADNLLVPCFNSLLQNSNFRQNRKIIRDLLSLPESITDRPPLFQEVTSGS